MLVLTRKLNEIITIGDDVTVMVVEIRGDTVRLGVCAPREVPVHRLEVFEAIKQEKTILDCRPAHPEGEDCKNQSQAT